MTTERITHLTIQVTTPVSQGILTGLSPLFPGMIMRGVKAVEDALLKHSVCNLPKPHRLVPVWDDNLVYARYRKNRFYDVVCTGKRALITEQFLTEMSQKILVEHSESELGHQVRWGEDRLRDAFWEGIRYKFECVGAPAPGEFLLLWPFYSLTFRLTVAPDGMRLAP